MAALDEEMGAAGAREALRVAEVERDRLEAEAEAILAELESPNVETGAAGPGLRGPLVDGEGFPRADVDVYRARELRHRHARLRTDHAALMRRIASFCASMNGSCLDSTPLCTLNTNSPPAAAAS